MRAFIVAALLLAVLAGCDPAPPKSAPQEITIAYTTQPDSALVHIAQAKGFFAQEGLRVLPQMHSYGKAAFQSVLEGRADLATAAETPLMFAALAGRKFFIVAGIFSTSSNNAIVGRRDLGIAGPVDLKGKRIGYTPGTTGEFFLDSFLTATGLSAADVVPTPCKPDEMVAALTDGKVDAVSCWNFPLVQLQRTLGARGVTFFDPQIYTQTFNLVARQEFVTRSPETVSRALRALLKAEQFAADHAKEAREIVAASLKVDPEMLRQVWGGFSYKVELDKRLLITLEDQARWAMKQRPGPIALPDFAGLVHPDTLAGLRPEAVTLR